jgi:hypothetical protein
VEELDFGFFFCRVMSYYGMGFGAVRALPVKTFWAMHRNIDRIEARDDQKRLALNIVSQSTPESVATYRQALVLEAGTIVRMDDEVNPMLARRDEDGFAELKRMAGQTIGQ